MEIKREKCFSFSKLHLVCAEVSMLVSESIHKKLSLSGWRSSSHMVINIVETMRPQNVSFSRMSMGWIIF